MFASLSLGVIFLKILFPFGQFTRGLSRYFTLILNLKRGAIFLKDFENMTVLCYYLFLLLADYVFLCCYNGFRYLSDLFSFAYPKGM
ncbi:hypothetical protein C3007_08255 [Avibacterium gallinarum]|nr:hypothetical protein C3007_08255 [Avibacterium gallinarum]